MSSMYELANEWMQLLEIAEDPEVDEQTLADTFEALGGEIEIKAENTAKVIKELEGKEAMLKEEADRLSARKMACTNNIKRIKGLLQFLMETTGKTKFEAGTFKFSVQNNAPSVVMDEQYIENVPDEYIRYKEPEVDRAKIKEALKNGVDLEGIAHLETTRSLRIR